MTRLAIDIDYLGDMLRELLDIPSPTGFTDNVARHVCETLGRLGVSFELTRRGAIRARLAGSARQPARGIISHLDTLGAQVRSIGEDGRLGLAPIGHWSARFAEGARATVFTGSGSYRGTILPPKASGHAFGDEVDEAPIGWDHIRLRLDAYAASVEQTRQLGVDIGDIVAIDPQPEFLDNGFIVSRHLDNKAGVASMLAALKALTDEEATPTVDTLWLFSISEEVGHGASALLTLDFASMVVVDNGCSAPGQYSSEFGVTIGMGDMTGPFDYHTTRKLIDLCAENDIKHQRDMFKHYRSDSASAIEAGADVRTALVTFGVDASHGYERIHMHALRSIAELLTAYALSPVGIQRDADEIGPLAGFPELETDEASQVLSPSAAAPKEG